MVATEHTCSDAMSPLSESLTIRLAYAEDYPALARLAELDSADGVPSRPLLIAEVGGKPRAALSLSDGSSIADPFHPTEEILALLGMRAAAAASSRRGTARQRLAGLSLVHG
jgi:hypothetical protein